MTNEEAIIRIRDHTAIHRMDEPQAILIAEALDMAISALEKQIPKKGNMISNRGTTYWSCPNCTSLIADSVTGVKYLHNCGICGQRICWGGEQK